MARAPIPSTLQEFKVPISGLTPYPQNPRRGNTAVIVESLSRHGQYRPIVVRAKTFEVLAGNHTLFAARELGWTEIAATFVDCTDDEAARIVLVDNRAADLGSYDDDTLTDLLASLADLEGTGFNPDDLATLFALRDDHDPGDLEAALLAADESAWPWVKVQLPPDDYARWLAVPGDDDRERLLTLLGSPAT
jgi:site-specific DNA-methyltransferase (adenine-specific)